MAYYRPIYDQARDEAYTNAGSSDNEYSISHVRAIVPNYARFTIARGMYSELNPVYNEVCPPNQMDGNIFNQQHQLPPPYPEQYSSPVDAHSQQLSVVAFGAHPADQRTFSPPGMSGSAGDLRNMGLAAHMSANAEPLASTSPRGQISAANRPDMQWMVTTSHIDMRTLTPPSSVMSQSSLPHGSGMNPSMATISHSGYGGPSAAVAEQKPIARNKNGKPKGTPGRKRKVEDHDLTPEEAAKRRVRRERNKLAAAKCRNRRRELTDRLQGETDILEDHQGMLTQEIIALQQEKDHLEFILASHTPRCKVLQDKSLNLMGNQSPPNVNCSNSSDCMGMHDHGDHCANLVTPIDVGGDLGDVHSSRRRQATTVSVIQAGPSLSGSLSRPMNENMYPANSSIVGDENMMHAQYSLQSDDPRNSVHVNEQARRFPTSLANLDLEQVVAGEPLNTPVCALATPSNTTAVFTFPSTQCVTSNSLANSGMNFSDAFTNADYNCSTSGSVMSTGNFLHPSQGQYNVSNTSVETCSAAHRRSSSSESHHSPDSVVQSPTLLSL